jgi:hypothetical protein
MATNRDLLKEAIADAKTVKETAIANAKAALEEAFTPYLKEKLSMKINEMDGIDEEEMGEKVYEEEMELEEVTLEELLAELEEGEDSKEMEENLFEAEKEEEESEEMSIEDMDEDDLKSFIEDVIKDMVSAGELEAGHEGENEEEEEEEMELEPEEGEEEEEEKIDEEIDINELLNEDDDESNVNLEELLAELGGDKEETNEESNEELEEAMATIATLRKDLNEVNLLNAKLLYTNKIFRNKSLTESQKIKVLTAFDKATTKKEVELVYETLNEGLKVSTITKSPIKESLSSASKALGSAKSKPIIENDAFARMRELAGLKK